MGTNYYHVTEAGNYCEHCKRFDEEFSLHIGKSSGGWAFALHIHPEEGISMLGDWVERWQQPNTKTIDSYGGEISSDEMRDIITNRKGQSESGRKPMGYSNWDEFHKSNFSYRGPHNLLFSAWRAVGNEDTYQLFNHEFC